jgi:hypothetical protein
MASKNLFIPGMDFGVTDLLKSDNENQKFLIDLHDNNPERIIEYTRYDEWIQTGGKPMLETHVELLGHAIKINFKELF